ncbi:MAG TPA: BON domain-containing protein [Vicinamibacterales bacterium]|jgi:hypothetical protein|nr:BON domain-containing protein [Vicinamibacterales bacterium]
MRTPDSPGLFLVAAAISILALAACRANIGGQELPPSAATQAMAPPSVPHGPAQPPLAVQPHAETDADRAVHTQLDRAFAQDANLKDQAISATVDGGDVTLTGSVQTAKQREKANEVVLNVPGVRSVANVLKVSP